jgi:hypothetical protein
MAICQKSSYRLNIPKNHFMIITCTAVVFVNTPVKEDVFVYNYLARIWSNSKNKNALLSMILK